MQSIAEFINQMKDKYSLVIVTEINNYINTKSKILKCNQFIKNCLNSETLPKFSRLKISNKDGKFKDSLEARITEEQLNAQYKTKTAQKKIQKKSTDILTFALDPAEWEQNNKLERKTTSRHNKKLNDHGINIIKPAYTNYINASRGSNNKTPEKQAIYNLSSRN